MRDKMITAVCRTVEGIEWTTVKVGQNDSELVKQESISLDFSGETVEELMALIELPDEVIESIKGEVSVPLRSADLLMRAIELPATEAGEISDMAVLQVDKMAPFSLDQLAFSHEVLRQSEHSSLVLLAAAKRSCIDAIGDAFEKQGIRIQSIDSRIQGWMQLLKDEHQLSQSGCDVVVIDDGIDFSLVVIDDGIPLAFRMLHAQIDDMNVADDLATEIEYTLTTLDAEHPLPAPSTLQIWSHDDLSASLRNRLAEKTGLKISSNMLSILPCLSEGIVRRATNSQGRIELIPQEWIEYTKTKNLQKKTLLASSIIMGIWLLFVVVFVSMYMVREQHLSSVKEEATALANTAQVALENRQKLQALTAYTDRSVSALECLREITHRMPPGDIQLLSYNYDKNKGVSIRGTSSNDRSIDTFFIALAKSTLFEQIKNQSSNPRTSKGIRLYVFSATLTLPAKEEEK